MDAPRPPAPGPRIDVTSALRFGIEIVSGATMLVMLDMFTGGHLRRQLPVLVARLDAWAHPPEPTPTAAEISALHVEIRNLEHGGGEPR